MIYFDIENLKEAPKVFTGKEIMQGLVATATTGSLIFLAPRFGFLLSPLFDIIISSCLPFCGHDFRYTRRHHSPILNKYVNQRVSFPRFDSLPKLQLSANSRSPREIAPLSGIISTHNMIL